MTITTLVAMDGCDTEVATHVNNAINVGVSSKKILDTLIQMLPYAGFARAINGIMVCKKVFDERDIDYSIDLEN
ncbi:carboxymuconolactone decarboxylase family protein [Vagococcus jeotgali]|uniref:carboxymuconolactone decarboxylase family protein n=1 Tax=Vagococcus jeotgali TaxID=3109030 RepID=UPI002DDC6F87|nr:carboxymuconolactone decarboxylase family protein [Vagococcus sp. B2T-5]